MYVCKMYMCIYMQIFGIRNLFLIPKHFHILAGSLNFLFTDFMNSMFYNHRYEILIDVSYISSRAY